MSNKRNDLDIVYGLQLVWIWRALGRALDATKYLAQIDNSRQNNRHNNKRNNRRNNKSH